MDLSCITFFYLFHSKIIKRQKSRIIKIVETVYKSFLSVFTIYQSQYLTHVLFEKTYINKVSCTTNTEEKMFEEAQFFWCCISSEIQDITQFTNLKFMLSVLSEKNLIRLLLSVFCWFLSVLECCSRSRFPRFIKIHIYRILLYIYKHICLYVILLNQATRNSLKFTKS